MDLSKIGLFVGVLAFILAVPLAIVANLLTPRVREWYSTTSQGRLKKHISTLEGQLRSSETQWRFSPAEWFICRVGFSTFLLVFLSVHTILSTLQTILYAYRHELRHVLVGYLIGPLWAAAAAVSAAYLVNLFFLLMVARHVTEARRFHTDSGRDAVKAEIQRLKTQVRYSDAAKE